MTDDDAAMVVGLAREMEAMAPMQLVLRPSTVFQLVGLMQLVLRRPDLPSSVSVTARTFIAGAREYFAACPTVLEVIDQGDDPSQDRSW